ncbi:glycosyltransferase family 2 protein [Cystobasidium minutum MCA 4210]|uniref:glycosyltransferase family 2 protein n=1 Tax=Cystobasidium minutum MCA 4210 TaxID=1397322 RepID=UPI0034CFC8A2|eukprot:jgi/Rhomi1/162898/estExt_Genewise1Plus.C_6_t20016
MSVVSTDREATSDAWVRRQCIKPGRAKTKKVKLTKGRFIAEYDVPSAVRNANSAGGYGHMTAETEFTHMRYTAATCDPDDFLASQGYSLRQTKYNRKTELLIAMTYYNEPRELVARTLFGIQTNIRDMVISKWSEFQLASKRDVEAGNGGDSGDASWKKVVVAIILDGIEPADKAALDIFAAQGIYQDSIMKKDIDGVPTVCHIFEYTTQISISEKPQLIFPAKEKAEGLVPTQFILCIKAKNAKKINSHRWLFNALGRHLNPEVCVLIDAGTKPQPKSIYLLWEAFHHNKSLGGAAGEIHAMLGKWGRLLFNPLVAAQNFEYKMSNILDKPTESAFGYVSVLPGAFSAYRYRAIQGRPLEQYFHGDATMAARMGDKYKQMSIFAKNMFPCFRAETICRILCFELVAKAGEKWTLGYVKPSKAETDVPEAAAELIGQRRRWLNGSLAAGVYSLWHFGRVYLSGHGMVRLAMLHVQALLNFVTLFMGFFALANLLTYLTLAIIIDIVAESLRYPAQAGGGDADAFKCWAGTPLQDTGSGFIHDHDVLGLANTGLKMVYLALLALQVILGLGNRPKAERFAYTMSMWIFGLLAMYLVVNTLYLTAMALCPMQMKINDALDHGKSVITVFTDGTFGPIAAGLLGTFGIWILASLLYLDPWHLLNSFVQYLFITISFTNVLAVYSFCNLHDVSWGTKGSDKAETLASVQTKKVKDSEDTIVEVEEQTQASIDERFKQTVMRAVSAFEKEEEKEMPTIDDANRTFRTRLVVTWLLVNAILCIAISRLPAIHRTIYFQVLLWITFGLSGARFMGFLYYMIGESLFRTSRLTARMLR